MFINFSSGDDMDQDFHYYGTYYAARAGGFSQDDATLIGKAANFIDFFNETTYAAYWKLVSDTQKSSNYNVVASMDCPRYTFQGGMFSTGMAPEDGLWCSYHFTPGNYPDPTYTPTRETVHGPRLANFLPPFQMRNTNGGLAELKKYPNGQNYVNDLRYGALLNRPQSALSRQLIIDAVSCATHDERLRTILRYATGGQYILDHSADALHRFKLILLGIRAHVIADTWAHQDFCGIGNVMNTYWDVNYDPHSWDPSKWGYGRQTIDYDDGTTSGWKNKLLSAANKVLNPNFEAVPTDTSYLGHGWMGHLPDFSFVKFRYKPCWSDPAQGPVVRDNPQQYKFAWAELLSLFSQSNGRGQLTLDGQFIADMEKAIRAIQTPCRLEGSGTGRKSSANAWQAVFADLPSTAINVDAEPDGAAVLSGMVEATTHPDRFGTDYVHINSDLYLFQIAADYHFHFVKCYLERNSIYKFTGTWSQQTSALAPGVESLFNWGQNDYVPNSNNLVLFNKPYRIRSVGHGTVLDDWDGQTGQYSAALQPDDTPNQPNRIWHLIPNAHGFRVVSQHKTALDDWGGETGMNSAALQPDDSPDSLNRTWVLVPNAHGFRIKSVGHNTVLDDWGGKTGQYSAALQPDDSPDSLNRTWTFVSV
jgi:hypothetical protein